jgi:hypothetical protein
VLADEKVDDGEAKDVALEALKKVEYAAYVCWLKPWTWCQFPRE